MNKAPLLESLHGEKVIFLGQSGVGKSTLLNEMILNYQETERFRNALGVDVIRPGVMYRFSHEIEGVWLRLPDSVMVDLVDTKRDLPHLFPEFVQVEHECKFRECTAQHETKLRRDCRSESGDIWQERYDLTIWIYEELDQRNQYINEKVDRGDRTWKVAPSILSANFATLGEDVKKVEN